MTNTVVEPHLRLMRLSDLFPSLSYPTRAAESFLARCSTLSIGEQLRDRKVAIVRRTHLLSSGGLSCLNRNFVILLSEIKGFEESALALGHELGHTFHYNLTYIPPKNILGPDQERDAEEFCKTFANRWVEANGLEKAIDWLKQNCWAGPCIV